MKITILTPEEKEFLNVFLHEATTSPFFSGPAALTHEEAAGIVLLQDRVVRGFQPCYDGGMKYEVDLPADVDQRLSAKASETGEDIVHLIRLAVVRFVDMEVGAGSNGHWSEETDNRRRELIDRDIAGSITTPERAELVGLDRLANEHFDRVAPPPMEGARRLHHQLVKNRASHK